LKSKPMLMTLHSQRQKKKRMMSAREKQKQKHKSILKDKRNRRAQ